MLGSTHGAEKGGPHALAIGSGKRPSGPSKRRRGEATTGWADGPEAREEEKMFSFSFPNFLRNFQIDF
jgi:hypothetical protein